MVSLVLQLCLVVTIEIILNFIKYFFGFLLNGILNSTQQYKFRYC